MDETRSAKLRRIESGVERRLRELAEQGQLRGLSGEGAPLPADGDPDDETWAARHVMRQANVVPPWIDLRKDIEDRRARITRRRRAHREWLHDRTLLLAELEQAVSELNALIRRCWSRPRCSCRW